MQRKEIKTIKKRYDIGGEVMLKQMAMITLGINAAFHDSSASIVRDGLLLAAAEEERFTQIKHAKRPIPFSTYELPFHAIDYCLKIAGIDLRAVDRFAYAFDPYLLMPEATALTEIRWPLKPVVDQFFEPGTSVWDPLFIASILNAPNHLMDGYPHHLSSRFKNTRINPSNWHFVDHHLSHAASSFFVSPFDEAAVFTIDGRGEQATTGYHLGKGHALYRIAQVNMPHSLGLLYESLTDYLGFLRSSDEYKVMAVASYGKPTFADTFRRAIHIGEKGQYTIDPLSFVDAFGPARERNGPLNQHHFDLAHSLQVVLEETVLTLLDQLYREHPVENLCMAGGVALNCVMNARIRDQGPFKNIYIQPASGDSGTALGAALVVDYKERGMSETGVNRVFQMDHAYWGPGYSDEEIENFLHWTKTPFKKLSNVPEETAELLAEDKIISWFQGRMEFGPRALGARSILASPIHASMQAKLNEVKDREDFRPVAPVVLQEEAHQWFIQANASPFMLFVSDVRPEKAGEIPAVTHTDGTARIQTINRDQNVLYYDLIKAFFEKTGVPILVNTSFNTWGKPIVCTPRDAVECFWSSRFDALVIGSYLIEKENFH